MTTIASYYSLSQAGKMHLSMISDSRITWTNEKDEVIFSYDYSQKIFKLENTRDIFGYCGDSLFCLSSISQIISYLRTSTEYQNPISLQRKMAIIFELIDNSIKHYPNSQIQQDFSVYLNTIFDNKFYAHRFFYNHKTNVFDSEPIKIPSKTGLVFKGGSGEKLYGNLLSEYLHEKFPVSRNYFKALTKLIESQADEKTGGPPQMCSLNLEQNKVFSVCVKYEKEYFLHGVHDIYLSNINETEYRDCDFNFLTPDGTKRNNYTKSFGEESKSTST